MLGPFCPRCIPRAIWALCAACLLVSLLVGSKLFHKTPVTIPLVKNPSVTLIFYVYDTQGNELEKARLDGPTSLVTPQITGPKCLLSRPAGEGNTLLFSYNGRQMPVEVKWPLGTAEYAAWLDGGFSRNLMQMDANYDKAKWQSLIKHFNGVKTETKYEYPIVFKTSP